MLDMSAQLGFDSTGLEAFLDSRNEPGWLTDFRREAWEHYCQMDWPARNDEEWMRTDLRLFKLDRFAPSVDPSPLAAAPTAAAPIATGPVTGLLAEGVELAGQSVATNGRPGPSRLDERWRAKGVLFGSLDELVREHGDLVRENLLRKAVSPTYDRFAALHAAFWSGGHLLYVPRGVTLSEPVHLLSILADGGADLGHTLVVLEDGAEATVLAEYASPTEETTGLHCGAVELLMGAGSNLRFVNLQNWGMGVWHFAHQKAIVGRDASLQWTLGAMGARLAKVNQHVELVEPGANCQVNGTMFTEGKQHLAYNTLQHHRAPECRSDFLYKAALQDKSRTVWRGMIRVDPGAIKTDGYQRNDNLLLSGNARADSIPGLQIEADDVRCTHGSTSGRVDEELIFYAQSRGFTRQEAIQMIVTGFFQQVYDRITIESVRDALARAITRRVREYAE